MVCGNRCDDCRKTTSSAWRCADCNFDLCLACFAKAKLPKLPEKKAPVVTTTTSTPPSTSSSSSSAPTEEDKFAVKSHVHRVQRTSTNLTGHFCVTNSQLLTHWRLCCL